ncbi:MAG: type I phosphomannose isomerase catalytic subunit [Planctomycetota bacterium]
MNTAEAMPPLTFAPILKEKVWGGRRLETLGKPLPDGTSVGESWELADLDTTSASGGGGDAAHSVVARGPHAGRTLRDLVASAPGAVLGSGDASAGAFPLLIKFLDANQNLSVQVHPSPAYAASHAGAHLKTESWYIVDAEPGAVIYKGVREGVSREQFAAAIEAGAVEDLLIAVPVRRGDFHHLPSGTCHALGGGILVAEVQTPSDTTFRVYDWGREGRELHIEPSLACIEFGPPARLEPIRARDGARRTPLEANEFYELAELRFEAGETETISSPGIATVRMHLEGRGVLVSDDNESLELTGGVTVLLPAFMPTTHARYDTSTVILEARLPA